MLKDWFGRGKGHTTVDEGPFHMRLPGHWERIANEPERRWTYRTDREQITVSLLGTDHALDSEEQARELAQYLQARRDAEATGDMVVELSEAVPAVASTVHVVRYEGIEPATTRWFTCFIMLAPSILATFYYEALNMSCEEFAERGRAAFNSIGLREPLSQEVG